MQMPDAEQLLDTIAHEIVARVSTNMSTQDAAEHTAIVGIHTGGVWMVERLLPKLTNLGYPLVAGSLDSAFYRDDYNQRGLHAEPKPANIPFEVRDKHIILVDDVFFTGRTSRAVINELFDYGRPASITLAVLVDRGGHELPIRPDIVGAYVPLQDHQNIQLSRLEGGTLHLSLEERPRA